MLADYIRNIKEKHPEEPINIVTHSHGGNTTLAMLSMLPDDISIDNLVLLANPWMVAWPTGWSGKAPENKLLYFDPASLSKVKNLWNVYTGADTVQGGWAGASHGISNEDIDGRYSWAVDANHLADEPARASNQTVKLSDDVKGSIKNVKVSMFGRSYKAHGALHSSSMGKFVGHLIQGGDPKRAKELAGLPDLVKDMADQGDPVKISGK